MPDLPRYDIPLSIYLALAAAALAGRRRSFREEARRMVASLKPPLRVSGIKNIPQSGPCVITVNHYWNPRFFSPWLAAVVSSQIPVDIYWTMANAWTYPPGNRLGRLFTPVTRWAFNRVARVYEFNPMPPMPPRPGDVHERAAAVQRMIAYARRNPYGIIGLAPEGGDQPGGVLGMPPAGTGRLALALAKKGMAFVPVGIYEEAGVLTVSFGQSYCLDLAELDSRIENDRRAREVIMRAIARCVPEVLRGQFSSRA